MVEGTEVGTAATEEKNPPPDNGAQKTKTYVWGEHRVNGGKKVIRFGGEQALWTVVRPGVEL